MLLDLLVVCVTVTVSDSIADTLLDGDFHVRDVLRLKLDVMVMSTVDVWVSEISTLFEPEVV